MIPYFVDSFFNEGIYLILGLIGIFVALRFTSRGLIRWVTLLGSISMLSRVIILAFYNYGEISIHHVDGWVLLESFEEFLWYFSLRMGVPLGVLFWGIGLLLLLKKSRDE